MPFVSVSARRSWQTRPHRGGRGSRRRRVAWACHDAGHGARRRALEVLGGGRPAPAGPARRGRPAGAGGPHEPGERRRGPLDERGGAAPGGRGAQHAAQPRRATARGARASAAQPAAGPARRGGAHLLPGRGAHERADHPVDHLPQRRAGVRQRVPLRAGGRGAALAAAPHRAGAARRGGRAGRRDRARAGRRRAARRRRRRAGRPAPAARGGARVRRGGADRRVAARREAQRRRSPRPSRRWTLPSCAFMGTVVREGSGLGVVVPHRRPDGRSARSRCSSESASRRRRSSAGLRDFSLLLVRVTAVLAGSILVINVALGRSLLESVLFALAIAVGLTPQLLPAIVTISLSTGAKRLAARKVVVKRLVSIEDLGNIVVLFTDKTGTLTEGRITFAAALDAAGEPSDAGPARRAALQRRGPLRRPRGRRQPARPGALGMRRARAAADVGGARRLAARPFDYERRLSSVLVEEADGRRRIIVKGAPETLLARCPDVASQAHAVLERQFAAGSRVIAVATRAADGRDRADRGRRARPRPRRLPDLRRPPQGRRRRGARAPRAPRRRGEGDHRRQRPRRAEGLPRHRPGRGRDAHRRRASTGSTTTSSPRRCRRTTIFARVTPEQKSRIIKAAARRSARPSAFSATA